MRGSVYVEICGAWFPVDTEEDSSLWIEISKRRKFKSSLPTSMVKLNGTVTTVQNFEGVLELWGRASPHAEHVIRVTPTERDIGRRNRLKSHSA